MRPRWLYPKPERKTLDFIRKIEELSNELIKEREMHGATHKAYNKAHEELEQANRLIEVLLNENTKLKNQFAQQEKPLPSDVKEAIRKVVDEKSTPNEQRKKIIESAKKLLEVPTNCPITFEVDSEARKVTAIMQSDKRGVGKIRSHLLCRDDQVFNEHIFKAATLANLTQMQNTTDYFVNAVQPDDQVIGQIVTREDGYEQEVKQLSYDKTLYRILDDTNAQY